MISLSQLFWWQICLLCHCFGGLTRKTIASFKNNRSKSSESHLETAYVCLTKCSWFIECIEQVCGKKHQLIQDCKGKILSINNTKISIQFQTLQQNPIILVHILPHQMQATSSLTLTKSTFYAEFSLFH